MTGGDSRRLLLDCRVGIPHHNKVPNKEIEIMKSLIVASLSTLLLSAPGTMTTTASSNTLNSDSSLIAQTQSNVIKVGSFVTKKHSTEGGFRIIIENNQRYLEFDNQFRTSPNQSLVVILDGKPDVIWTTAAPTHSIQEKNYLVLNALKSIQGSQRYLIPSYVNLDDYHSVAIWCRISKETFGSASLN